MKIYIARHGETDFNKLKKCQGRIDNPLNANGIRQAQQLALGIDKNFDIIFTSPLKRATQTAEILSKKLKIPIIEKDELMERDWGTMSGKTWEEMFEAGGGKIDFRKKDFDQEYDYRPYGGENVEDVKKRFLKFIDELKQNYSDKRILIVAHGGIIKLSHFLFFEEKPIHTPDNASIYEFEI